MADPRHGLRGKDRLKSVDEELHWLRKEDEVLRYVGDIVKKGDGLLGRVFSVCIYQPSQARLPS